MSLQAQVTAIAMLCGLFFWLGAESTAWLKPVAPPRIVVQPENLAIKENENCTELARACYARKRSARIGGFDG